MKAAEAKANRTTTCRRAFNVLECFVMRAEMPTAFVLAALMKDSVVKIKKKRVVEAALRLIQNAELNMSDDDDGDTYESGVMAGVRALMHQGLGLGGFEGKKENVAELLAELKALRSHVAELEILLEYAESGRTSNASIDELMIHCLRTDERPTVEAIQAACNGQPLERCLHEMAVPS